MTRTADAVVIGAGVIGAAVALELARSGQEVVVVDRGHGPGSGSTSSSASIVRFHYSTWDGVATSWESKHCWEDWGDFLGLEDPAGLARYVPTGGLVLDSPGLNRDRILELFRTAGIPCEELTPADLREWFPYLDNGRFWPPRRLYDPQFRADADGELGGFWTPEGGFIDDPVLSVHNLLHAAVCTGVTPLFRRQVTEIPRVGDRVRGVVLADGERIDAPIVVNVAGPWSGHVNRIADVLDDFRITTRPLRQEVHTVAAPPSYSVDRLRPFVSDGDLGIYFRPTPGGDVLVGGMEPECDPLQWVDDPDQFDPNPTAAAFEAQVTRLARRMPDVGVPGRASGVVGLYDVTGDWIPVYDRTALGGFYVAVGTSGNQFKNAPVVGQLMRHLIDACESGHDHDSEPLRWLAPRTANEVNLGHYSRLRQLNLQSSYSVLA